MNKTKIRLIILISIFLAGLVVVGVISAQANPNPLQGKIIALDAGHGGNKLGAQYPANSGSDGVIFEKDVNLAVVYALKNKLEPDDNCVVLTRVCDETIGSNKERVDIAKAKCKSECGGECDVLISNHHNGSTDSIYDGLLIIYGNKHDIPLAEAVHDSLFPAMQAMSGNPETFKDEGFDSGGYGVTVYGGNLRSILTESYYITNTYQTEQHLIEENGEMTFCGETDDKYTTHSKINQGRINTEADALYWGLYDYFNASGSGGGGGNGGGNGGGKPDGPPGQNK